MLLISYRRKAIFSIDPSTGSQFTTSIVMAVTEHTTTIKETDNAKQNQ